MNDFNHFWEWAVTNSGKTVNTLADGSHLTFKCEGDEMTITNSEGNSRSRTKEGVGKAVSRFNSGETVRGDDRYFAAPYRHWKSAFVSPDERDSVRKSLNTIQTRAQRWILEEIEAQAFFLATRNGNKRIWKDLHSEEVIELSTKAGLYLVYHIDKPNPVYVGMASNLSRRLKYHFGNNRSSDANSTLKKNLRRDSHWTGVEPLETSFRFKVVEVPFGRVELEKHLHELFGVNTGGREK